MNKLNRTLAGVMIALSVFLMGAGAYQGMSLGDYNGVTVIENGYTQVFITEAETVQGLLEELGVWIRERDCVIPAPDTAIHRGMTIEIRRAFPVYIRVDQSPELIPFYARYGSAVVTIAADFSRLFSTSDDYQFYFSREAARRRPAHGEIVHLQTITWVTTTEYAELPFTREYVESFLVAEGYEEIYQEGAIGFLRSVYQTEYIGGLVNYIGLVTNGIYLEPLTEIVHVGVAVPEGMAVSACGVAFAYMRQVYMESTAYTLSFSCTGRHPGHPLFGVTASGMMAQRGVVAVDTSVIPFHTTMYIEGYGFAVAGGR
ncbi:MAG: G5 domain-containing protein, partial [Defluviitaleaceae bacterium]|nr:G5 domain-containing protein [Defluviitaleaceae bacterium]